MRIVTATSIALTAPAADLRGVLHRLADVASANGLARAYGGGAAFAAGADLHAPRARPALSSCVWSCRKEPLWLQLGYFPCNIFFFVAGCAAARTELLERITWRDDAPWLVVSILALVTLPVIMLTRGQLGGFEGGWHLNAFYYALWDPLVAFGVMLGVFAAARQWGGIRHGSCPGWHAAPSVPSSSTRPSLSH
ncbi:hypothetical protein [Sphingobium ummariense]